VELTDLHLEILEAALHGAPFPGDEHEEAVFAELAEAGLLTPDEDEYELYGYEITEYGIDEAYDAGLIMSPDAASWSSG
jgi:hypothetical protein